MRGNRREHARFLVELMSPFASRAGTQGITSVSNRSISHNRQAAVNAKLQYHVAKLSPIKHHQLLLQSQRNNDLGKFEHQATKAPPTQNAIF